MPSTVPGTLAKSFPLTSIPTARASIKPAETTVLNSVKPSSLVWCLAYNWCFAARDFGLPLGASDEHTRLGSVRSEQRRGRPKELLPEGLRRKWPGASLLLSHRSLRICSFVAPRPRPFWAQRNTSYLRDTTLAAFYHALYACVPKPIHGGSDSCLQLQLHFHARQRRPSGWKS